MASRTNPSVIPINCRRDLAHSVLCISLSSIFLALTTSLLLDLHNPVQLYQRWQMRRFEHVNMMPVVAAGCTKVTGTIHPTAVASVHNPNLLPVVFLDLGRTSPVLMTAVSVSIM